MLQTPAAIFDAVLLAVLHSLPIYLILDYITLKHPHLYPNSVCIIGIRSTIPLISGASVSCQLECQFIYQSELISTESLNRGGLVVVRAEELLHPSTVSWVIGVVGQLEDVTQVLHGC